MTHIIFLRIIGELVFTIEGTLILCLTCSSPLEFRNAVPGAGVGTDFKLLLKLVRSDVGSISQ